MDPKQRILLRGGQFDGNVIEVGWSAESVQIPCWDGMSMMWSDISQRMIPAFGAYIYQRTDKHERGLTVFEA